MLILDAEEVRLALPMSEAIRAMRAAFTALAEGRAQVPLRSQLVLPGDRGVTLVMPACLEGRGADVLTVKVVSLLDGNPKRGLARLQGTVLVLDPETGRLEGLVEGASLTALRTGAVCGLATELLARGETPVVAVFGAGVQGRSLLEAVCEVRRVETVLVCDPCASAVERFVEELAGKGKVPADVHAATAREAASRADVICTATSSAEPVFDDVDLRPGVHVNAVGSYQPHVRELPPETVCRAHVVVDDRGAALEEAGDLIQPLRAGLIDAGHVRGSLGEILIGLAPGRGSDEEVTLFKSVGLAVQDAAAARAVIERARRDGLGVRVG